MLYVTFNIIYYVKYVICVIVLYIVYLIFHMLRLFEWLDYIYRLLGYVWAVQSL